jgi:FlgD Ig-like domain
MKYQQVNCQQAMRKLEEYRRAGIRQTNERFLDKKLLEHLSDCTDCFKEVAKHIDVESILSGALAESGSACEQEHLASSTPLQFLRTRIEARIDGETSSANQPIRNPVMNSIFKQIKNRSRLSIGVAFATMALLAATLIPLKYDSAIGYEVAFAGVNKDLALDSDKIAELLEELGVQGAVVDVSGCETTCNLKITDLTSLEDGRLLIAAFESGGAVHLTNDLTPVVEIVSGTLLSKVNDLIFLAKSDGESSEGELHNIIIERLGDNYETKIESFFGVIDGDSIRISVDAFDIDGDNQWVMDSGPGDHALMFYHTTADGDSLNLQQFITSGDVTFKSVDSGSGMKGIICIGVGDSAHTWNMDDLSGFDFSGGQLTDEQIAELEAKGYTVTITTTDDGQQQIMLRKSSESETDGERKQEVEVIKFVVKGDALGKNSFDDDPSNPDVPTALPEGFALSQNYPNPFNPTTKIDYTLASPERVRIDIINVMGQVVRTLVDEQVGAGTNTVEWDATDDNGRQVASGMYFYRFKAGNLSQTKKMTLLK